MRAPACLPIAILVFFFLTPKGAHAWRALTHKHPGKCVGKALDTHFKCGRRSTKDACLRLLAVPPPSLTVTEGGGTSCQWIEDLPDRKVVSKLVYTKTTAFSEEFQHRPGTTGYVSRVAVPLGTSADWGFTSKWSTPISYTTCTGGLGLATECSVSFIPPAGYVPPTDRPAAARFTNSVDLNIREPHLVRQLQANGQLEQPLPVVMEHTLLKGPSQPPSPMLNVTMRLGGQVSGMGQYHLTSLAVLNVKRATRARWHMRVGPALGALGTQTPLSVLLIPSRAWADWNINGCDTVARPPEGLAIATPCVGLECEGHAEGLDPALQYRLQVSYPFISCPAYDKTFSVTGPVPSVFPEETFELVVEADA